MKKGERKQASMENVQGLDGWQSLARTVEKDTGDNITDGTDCTIQ